VPGPLRAQGRGFQPFQECGPINKQTEGPWPTDYATSPMRQLLHMHRAKIKSIKNKRLMTQRALQSIEDWACLLLETKDIRGSIHDNA